MTFMEGQDPYPALCHPPMFASSLLTRVCASSEGQVAARKLDNADSHKNYSERYTEDDEREGVSTVVSHMYCKETVR